MAFPANERSSKGDGGISMKQLVEELSKQCVHLKEDISTLIQKAIGPLQA